MTTRDKLEIRTPDGVAEAFTYRPEGKGPWPGIIFYFDAGGIRPSQHQMCERLASLGYVVLLPNLYYRSGEYAPFDMKTVFGNPSERARIMGLIQSLDNATAMRDAGAYIDALLQQPGVAGDKVGCVGHCMGGRLAFTTAAAHPARVAGAASFHGGHVVSDDPTGPFKNAGKIQARLYFGVADNDMSCTPEHQGALATALGAAHVPYQIELYPGKGHGFAVPDMPTYDEAAAEQHWKRTESFFGAAFAR